MQWRLPDWRSLRAFMRLRLAALASSANAQLAKVLRPKVARTLAVLFFFSVVAVAAHAAAGGASVTLTAPPNYLGLIGYWPFDSATTNFSTGKTTDLSGNNNTGTMVNMTHSSLEVPGKLGQALSFNGTSQYVNIPSSNSLDVSGGEFSVSVWVKLPSSQSAWPGIVGKGAGNNDWFIQRYGGSSNIILFLGGNSGVNFKSGSWTAITDNKWHHLVVVLDHASGKQYMYLDGQLYDTETDTSLPTQTSTFPVIIGAERGLSYFLNGSIDDVRIYNRALSATEVQQMYDAGLPGVGSATRDASPTSLVTNGLVGYWTFDGQNTNWTANTTADVSGKGNTGTLVNMSTTTSPVLGRFGQALNFNGAGYVTINNSASSFNFGTGNFSISIWFKEPFGAPNTYLFSKYYSNNYPDYDFGLGPNDYCPVGTKSIDFTMGLVNGGCITENVWHHVVGIRNGGILQLYLDGKPDGSDAIATSTSFDNPGLVKIGGHTFQNPFPGIIDDVRVYDRALSQTEVTQLYDAGAIGATIDTAPAQALSGGGLVGYWPFDGNKMNWASSLALDASGNGNNGTLVNMTTANAVMGVIGQALSFNGTSQYVTANLYNSGTVSLSAWVYPTSYGVSRSMIVQSGDNAGYGDHIWWWFGSQSTVPDTVSFYNGSAYVNSNTVVPLNKWSLLTVVNDVANNKISFYFNGQPDGSSNSSNNLTSTTISFGADFHPTYYFQGSIDDVRIYNRALSASEVKQLYNLGR